MIPIPLIILGASALLKHQNDRAAQKRQQQIAGAMEAFQRKKSGESMAATEALLAKQTPEARGAELADVTGAREQSLRDTVGAAQAFDAPASAGKQSGDFRAAQEKEAASIAERTRRAITQLAAMGAPGEQKQAHQLRFGKAAGDVDAANLASDAVGNRYMQDINNVKPNPMIDMISQVGMGVGSGMMAGGFTGATAAAGGAQAMGAGDGGHFDYEDSAGNLQRSSIPYQRRQQLNRGFSLWGAR
jgi:hypothetical protein